MFYSLRYLCTKIIGLIFVVRFSTSSPIEKREPKCFETVIPVTITANNAHIVDGIGMGLLLGPVSILTNNIFTSQLFGLALNSPVSGTYNIAGRYCEPEVVIPSRQNTLQLLAHPATYDRNYWSGGGYPGYGFGGDAYSWVSYASKHGYPTFSFDRLGNGNSSHPDPITEVQCPAQAATIHSMVSIIRAGPYGGSPLPRAFNKIILVGCSLGSVVANIVNQRYPNDVDATILTGFTRSWVNVVPGFIATAGLLPAPGLALGYLQATNPSGVNFLLQYAPHYDSAFASQDFAKRGTITVGEGVTGALGISAAPQYKKPVYVVTGEQDTVFCGSLGLEVTGPGNCGSGSSGILAQTKQLYPNAAYSYYAVPNAGHCWEHGLNAQLGFNVSHTWLATQGF